MIVEDRARVIYEELTTYKHVDPVAWLTEALRRFERDILQGANTQPGQSFTIIKTMAATPDGEE